MKEAIMFIQITIESVPGTNRYIAMRFLLNETTEAFHCVQTHVWYQSTERNFSGEYNDTMYICICEN